MDSRWKAMCTVGVIVVCLSAFHLYQTITLQRNHLQETINLEKNLHKILTENTTKQSLDSYRRKIENFSRTRSEIIAAFASRDREKLYNLCRPYYETLRQENDAFYIFHFYLPDNRSFLRLHLPDTHGDDLSHIRPIVKEVNETHGQQSGFEVGVLGLFYRVTQPLFWDNQYIGVVEFGLKVDQLLKPLHKGSSDHIAVLINQEHYQKAFMLQGEKRVSCGPYVLLPQAGTFFQKITTGALDCPSDWSELSQDGRVYYLSRELQLDDFQGNSIGNILIAHDITDQKKQLQKIVRVSVTTSLILLGTALAFLYFSIGTLLSRIFKLNRSLREMNDGLENTVKARTAELEHEINERKQANLELKQEINHRLEVEKKLADEKEMLTVTLRSIGDGVISTNREGNIILLNRNAEQLTGWGHQESLGRPLHEIFHIVNEHNGAPLLNMVENITGNGNTLQLGNQTALIVRDGSKIYITASAAPIYDRQRDIIGVIIVFRNVTTQKRLEEEVIKVQKLESVGILAGGIAHDFNNILSAILGNVNLASEMIGPQHEARDVLLRAEKATLRARDLTRQLLTFAKGGAPVKLAASINELIRESADFILAGRGVKCSCHFSAGLRPLHFDAGQMSQVMQNIILNSCQAMGNQGRIVIRTENIDQTMSAALALPPADYVKITITDSGKGIEAQNLAKIFDPYFSTKEKGPEKGSGLGLAIVYSIITQHGGFIRAESRLGTGTTFTIFLPAGDGEAVEMTEQAEPGNTIKGTGKILVMDDEAIILEVAANMLSHLGYEAVLCRDGQEMLDCYREAMRSGRVFDAVIADLVIPGDMSGEQAVQELLLLDPLAKTIVASGNADNPIMTNYRQHGFKGVLHKPYKLVKLSRVLEQVTAGEQQPAPALS